MEHLGLNKRGSEHKEAAGAEGPDGCVVCHLCIPATPSTWLHGGHLQPAHGGGKGWFTGGPACMFVKTKNGRLLYPSFAHSSPERHWGGKILPVGQLGSVPNHPTCTQRAVVLRKDKHKLMSRSNFLAFWPRAWKEKPEKTGNEKAWGTCMLVDHGRGECEDSCIFVNTL